MRELMPQNVLDWVDCVMPVQRPDVRSRHNSVETLQLSLGLTAPGTNRARPHVLPGASEASTQVHPLEPTNG